MSDQQTKRHLGSCAQTSEPSATSGTLRRKLWTKPEIKVGGIKDITRGREGFGRGETTFKRS